MNTEQSPEQPDRASELAQRLVLFVLCLVLFGISYAWAIRNSARSDNEVRIIRANSSDTAATEATAPHNQIVVHVGGAVQRPGLYTLPATSRVDDALKAAGGPLPDAELAGINPAARMADADQIIVPQTDSPATGAPPSTGEKGGAARRSASRTRDLTSPADGAINVNTAGAADLERLPGIGPALAARIVEYRKEIGRFSSLDQLLEVRGIGEKKFATMRPFVKLHR